MGGGGWGEGEGIPESLASVVGFNGLMYDGADESWTQPRTKVHFPTKMQWWEGTQQPVFAFIFIELFNKIGWNKRDQQVLH